MESNWEYLSYADKNALRSARENQHQAAQLVALAARSLLPSDPGDGYANLEWQHQMLLSQAFYKKFRTALGLANLTLKLMEEEVPIAEYSLNGKSYEQALHWMKQELLHIGADGSKLKTALPYEIPVYPTAQGEPFQVEEKEAFYELANYFANADLVLRSMAQETTGASEVRCWPHHFDIATLITLAAHEDPEKAKTIGVGFSPGDGNYDRPYFYVTPWPYPKVTQKELPALPAGGFWHTRGWIGAILSQTELAEIGNSETQYQGVKDYLQASTAHLKSLLA